LSILAFRKPEKQGVNCYVSRIVEAIWAKSDGGADVTLEAMITSNGNEPVNSLEIFLPLVVKDVKDITDTFLDDELFENKARQSGYEVVDREKRKVKLSGILCDISPVVVTCDVVDNYSKLSINFKKNPVKPNEIRPFRLTFNTPTFAEKFRSYYRGTVTYEFCISLYDIIREGSSKLRKLLEEHKERIIHCERIHIWLVLPDNAELMAVTPAATWKIPHKIKGPLSKEEGKSRIALAWEPPGVLDVSPAWNELRISGTYKRTSLRSITTGLAIVGLVLSITSLTLHFL